MNETLNKINEIFSTILNKENLSLSLTDTPNDIYGWDSLTHARLITEIEDSFNVQFRLKELAEIKCIGDIVKIVDSKTR